MTSILPLEIPCFIMSSLRPVSKYNCSCSLIYLLVLFSPSLKGIGLKYSWLSCLRNAGRFGVGGSNCGLPFITIYDSLVERFVLAGVLWQGLGLINVGACEEHILSNNRRLFLTLESIATLKRFRIFCALSFSPADILTSLSFGTFFWTGGEVNMIRFSRSLLLKC